MFIFDAHLDLSMNALEWNRDLREPLDKLRDRGSSFLRQARPRQRHRFFSRNAPWPDRQSASPPRLPVSSSRRIVFLVGTRPNKPGLKRRVNSPGIEPWKNAANFSRSETANNSTPISNSGRTNSSPQTKLPIGYILSLEGADSILSMRHLERAYENGLRALGPAHYGPGTYAQGTDATGGMGDKGRELLKNMDRLGMILDATHLCDDSFWEAMDHFAGPVWASHHNVRTLVPHNRQLADDQIKVLVQRGAVIGAVFDAWMMVPGWQRGKSTPEAAGLKIERIIDHIDHICQLAGSSLHCGIGSDLDGAFGTEQTPADLKTITDLQRIPELLASRGYKQQDVENIMHANFIRFLQNAWKA
jgi:membrane dipeptidase